MYATPMQIAVQGIRNGIENFRGRSEPKRQHGVHIHSSLPLNSLEPAILGVDRDQAVGLYVNLGQ